MRSIRLGCPVIGLEQTQEIEMGEMADFERGYGDFVQTAKRGYLTGGAWASSSDFCALPLLVPYQ